jgi:membrane protein
MATYEIRSRRPAHSGWSVLTGFALVAARYALRERQRERDWRDASGQPQTRDPAGRAADSPTEIPTRGWKDIAMRVYSRIGEDRILVIAAGTVFYGILALFPAIAALVSIYGMFASPADIAGKLSAMSSVLPGGAIDVVGDQMTRVASQNTGSLGVGAIIGLLIALWSANAGTKAVFDGLNVAYREKEKRGFISLNVSSLIFTVAMLIFAVIALGAMVVVPNYVNRLGLGEVGQWAVTIGQWPIVLLLVSFVFACLYRFGPSRDEPKWRWITPGSVFAAIVWLVASLLFSWYAANFGSYNKTYGSLGAIIGFMTWLWISSIVVILGGVLNAEMEHQTDKDTTKGAPQPKGARGAYVADNKPGDR